MDLTVRIHRGSDVLMILIKFCIQLYLITMTDLWMEDELNALVSPMPITPSMQTFVNSLLITCYPALPTDSFMFWGGNP
jgi:hypothetical protein